MKRAAMSFLAAGLLLAWGADGQARIKLVALPEREAIWVRLDNPAFTVVEEERILTLQKGQNQVDFSWKGVSIDPDSIRLRMLDHPQEVQLISVSYPPDEAALVWQVHSPQAYSERVRISYLLSNLDRLVTYEGLAAKDEGTVDLKSYLVLRNFSGEDLVNARVQLDYGEAQEKSIQHQETKRMLFFSRVRLPNEKTFTWDDQRQPWDPEKVGQNVGIPVYYTLHNTKERGLGEHALWGGKVRVYQEDGRGSTILLGEDTADLVPVGEKMRIRIGDGRDMVVTQRKMKEERIVRERNNSGSPILSDTDEVVEARIENFRDRPALLILTEHIPGQWDMKECTHPYELKDFQTLEFRIELKDKEKVKLVMHYQRRNLR
jgi:hypothetical protein